MTILSPAELKAKAELIGGQFVGRESAGLTLGILSEIIVEGDQVKLFVRE